MARKRDAEEEVVEDEGAEEAAPAGAEFVPEQSLKPKSDVYTLVLILTFCAFLAGCILAGREAYEHYDVQFWVFDKAGKKQEPPPSTAPSSTPPATTGGATDASTPPPAPPAPPPE